MSIPEQLPSRESDAGPDTTSSPQDWKDLNWEAYDFLEDARVVSGPQSATVRRVLMHRAIQKIHESIALLAQENK